MHQRPNQDQKPVKLYLLISKVAKKNTIHTTRAMKVLNKRTKIVKTLNRNRKMQL